MRLDDLIRELVENRLRAEADEIENLLVEAIRLQDFDKLDCLVVIRQDGHAPSVGSMLGEVE